MLFLVATPIGNLEDITLRALGILKECDYILCEDTRHSLKLLEHYQIHKPLYSFHQHNEERRQEKILDDLREGKVIALISDAGTPLVSDPGYLLVKECQKHNLPVTSLPGPCAVISALVLSGLDPTPFQFIGFLPKNRGERLDALQTLLEYPGTSICYETAERIHTTLKEIDELDPTTKVVIARELTKHFETIHAGLASELKEVEMRGELVLLIEGKKDSEPTSQFSNEFLQACVADLATSMSTKDAIAKVAQQLKLPKRLVYNAVHVSR